MPVIINFCLFVTRQHSQSEYQYELILTVQVDAVGQSVLKSCMCQYIYHVCVVLCRRGHAAGQTTSSLPGKCFYFLFRVYTLAASVSSHTCDWSGLHSWIDGRREVKCDCDCLLIIVRLVMDWQLVQGVPCLLPSAFWDTVQPVVTSNCIWYQHTSRLILSTGLIWANSAHLFDYNLFMWFYGFSFVGRGEVMRGSLIGKPFYRAKVTNDPPGERKIKQQQDFLWSTGKY